MAGQPKKQAMIRELERLTHLEFEGEPATPLDYVELHIANGSNLTKIAAEISTTLGVTIHREVLSKYVNGLAKEASSDTLARARARGAHALSERALDIAMAVTDKDEAQVARLQVATLQWQAERANSAEFGARPAGVTVNLTVGSLHLDALRQVAIEPALVVEAEDVTVIPATSSATE